MAYIPSQPPRLAIPNGNVDDPNQGLAFWTYNSPTDSLAVVAAPGYMNPAPENMQIGDLVYVFDITNNAVATFRVASFTGTAANLGFSGSVSSGGKGTNISNLSKMQKLAASAQRNNLIYNPANSSAATITSPASAPSTTGFTNIFGSPNGYVVNITSTITVGNPTIGVSSTTNLAIGQWLVEATTSPNTAFPTLLQPGTRIVSISSANSTITVDKNPIASGSITVRFVNQFVNFIGGVPFDFNNNLVIGGSQTNNAQPHYGFSAPAIEFETDAQNFTSATVLINMFINGTTPNSYRVAIDGQYATYAAQTFGASSWISIVFPTVSSSVITGTHTVLVEFPVGCADCVIWVPTGSSVWQSKNPIPTRLSFFGDSFMYSGASGTWPQDCLAARVANKLGCYYDTNSVAGTGYISNGSGANYAWSAPQRTNNVAYRNYDGIVVFGSVNDNGQTAVAMQAAALTTFKGLRANAPNAPIFIFGVPVTVNNSLSAATILENGIAAAFAQWGDTNAWYFPITTDPNGAWINSNNLSTYIGGDNTHPTDPQGYSFIADKMVQAISSVLQTVQY